MTVDPQTMGNADGHSFLKWVGGKTRTAPLLVSLAPPAFRRYIEPFMGSAAVFFALAPPRATLSDLNEELVVCFEQVRDAPEAVMDLLRTMNNTKDAFLQIRAMDPATLTDIQRAARVIYLNKTAFRGLWRVNKHGNFNVPYGAYDRPLFNAATVRAASVALQAAELRVADFENTLAGAKPGDWVYLDPPYVPVGGFSDFKRYTAGQFREEDHQRLAALCENLHSREISFLLTNTNSDEARALYSSFALHAIPTRRDVNLNKLQRSSTDLLVANYDISDRLRSALGA